jgi:hypothetical protein
MPPPKPSEWRRWLGIGLRALHLAGVTLLGSVLLGAPAGDVLGPLLTLASGIALLAIEVADGRVHLGELAGAVVLAKLAIVGWMLFNPAHAPWLFWAVLLISAVVSHAPRDLRHWRPGRG